MIEWKKEDIATASASGDKGLFHWWELPGWITDGHFALLVGGGNESS